MKLGGISTSNGAQIVLRWATLFVPLFISVFTFLSGQHIIDASFAYPISDELLHAFSLLWLLSGPVLFVLFRTNLVNAAFRLLVFHVLGGVYIALFTGFSFPLTILWLILVLASYGYFGAVGAVTSLGIMVGASALDSALHETAIAANATMAISIIIMSIMILMLMRVQERDEAAFLASQEEESLQRESLMTLINNITDAVLSTDNRGRIRMFNAATIGLLDTNTNLIGKSINDVIALKSENGTPHELLPLLKESDSVRINDEFRLATSEEELRLEITYAPIKNAYTMQKTRTQGDGYIIILRDVTKTKSLEEERDEFISVVSHELRTPITIAEGAIDNAQLIFNKDARKRTLVRKSLETAHDQIVFLSKMVNDLSTLSRAERGVADEPELIDVDALAHSLYDEYSPEAMQKGLHFNLSLKGKVGNVKASRLYLQELLQNFITNSIKYTKTGSVTLEILRDDEMVIFAVKDTGIGISKADQIKIFDKFYRSEDYRTRETGGTGLGLHVARKLSRKLNTEIDVESRLNYGSTFSFMLPAVKDVDVSPEVQ